MRIKLVLWLVSPIWFSLSCYPADARILEAWPYERLYREADLVVIGTAISTKDTSDKFIDKRWPLEFVGLNTTFKVMQHLKGSITGKTIVVLHYKFGQVNDKEAVRKAGGVEIIDGPTFLSFQSTAQEREIGGYKRPESKLDYLLFLKKRADGRYQPVSGFIDPDMSVRELFEPFFSICHEVPER